MRLFSIIMTICFSLIGQAQSGEEVWYLSLAEAKEYAIKYHPDVKMSMVDVAKAEEQINEVKAMGLPQVSASADLNYYPQLPISLLPAQIFDPMAPEGTFAEIEFGTKHNLTAGLSASQLVFDGSYLLGLRAASVYSDLVKKQARQSGIETQDKVEKAYLSALIARENIKMLNKNIPTIDRLLFETEQLYINGFVEEIEVDRLKLSKSNLLSQINTLQEQEKLAVELLKFQMGYPANSNIVLTDELGDHVGSTSYLQMENEAKKRIEYEVLEAQGKFTDLQIQRYKSLYWPNVVAYGNYQWAAQRDKFNYLNFNEPWFNTFIIGLKMNVPIYDGGLKKSQMNQVKLDKQKLKYSEYILDQAIALEIKQAKINYNNALEQKTEQEKNIALAQKIYDTALIKYKEGLGSSLEVSSAESTLLETQTQFINSLYNLIIAKSDLNKAYGNY